MSNLGIVYNLQGSKHKMKSPIKRQTVGESLIEHLRQSILEGEIAEGTQLVQEMLAKKYDVSRIPVREALRQLEAEGLVLSHAHRGYVVASLSLRDIEEIFEIRSVLEPQLLAHSFAHFNQDVFDHANQLLCDYEVSFLSRDVSKWGELNWAFHTSLTGLGDRPLTLDIVNNLQLKIDRYTRLQFNFTDGIERAQEEHRALLQLCREGSLPKAQAMLRNHILSAGQSLITFLKSTHNKS